MFVRLFNLAVGGFPSKETIYETYRLREEGLDDETIKKIDQKVQWSGLRQAELNEKIE